MAINKKIKRKIIKQIEQCLFADEDGRTGLVSLQKRSSQVSKSTFYRWVRSCLDSPPAWAIQGAKDGILERAKKRSPRTLPRTALKNLKAELPFTVAPETMVRIGIKTFDFVLEMEKLYKDVELVRGKAVKPNEESEGEKVINPRLLLETVKSRRGLIDTRINAQTLLLDMGRLTRIHNFVFELVAEMAPEVFPEMVRRIEQFEQENGLKI